MGVCTSARVHVCVCVRDLMRSITVCEAQLAAAQSRKQVQTWLLDVQGDWNEMKPLDPQKSQLITQNLQQARGCVNTWPLHIRPGTPLSSRAPHIHSTCDGLHAWRDEWSSGGGSEMAAAERGDERKKNVAWKHQRVLVEKEIKQLTGGFATGPVSRSIVELAPRRKAC